MPALLEECAYTAFMQDAACCMVQLSLRRPPARLPLVTDRRMPQVALAAATAVASSGGAQETDDQSRHGSTRGCGFSGGGSQEGISALGWPTLMAAPHTLQHRCVAPPPPTMPSSQRVPDPFVKRLLWGAPAHPQLLLVQAAPPISTAQPPAWWARRANGRQPRRAGGERRRRRRAAAALAAGRERLWRCVGRLPLLPASQCRLWSRSFRGDTF